jgi:hypothetical protein
MLDVQLEFGLEAERRQKEQERKERGERRREMFFRISLERSERDRQARLTEEQANAQHPCLSPWQEEELTACEPTPESDKNYDQPTLAPMPDFAGRVARNCAMQRTNQTNDPQSWRPRASRTGPTNGFCADPRLPARR